MNLQNFLDTLMIGILVFAFVFGVVILFVIFAIIVGWELLLIYLMVITTYFLIGKTAKKYFNL